MRPLSCSSISCSTFATVSSAGTSAFAAASGVWGTAGGDGSGVVCAAGGSETESWIPEVLGVTDPPADPLEYPAGFLIDGLQWWKLRYPMLEQILYLPWFTNTIGQYNRPRRSLLIDCMYSAFNCKLSGLSPRPFNNAEVSGEKALKRSPSKFSGFTSVTPKGYSVSH